MPDSLELKMYPAMKMHMGKWEYYVVRMSMQAIANEIRFAHELHKNKTLNTQIQRAINDSRVKKQIVKYLSHNEHRFFGSIVVAGLKGNPKWIEVNLENDERMALFADRYSDTFGLITFDETIETYALDGQHRVSAIKEILKRENVEFPPAENFEKETMSIIYLQQKPGQDTEEFIKDFRRVFASLNRHAKPVSKNTIVIMDEDDRFAIATRNLIAEHDFFNAYLEEEKEGATTTICDFKSTADNISKNSKALITIVGLYKMVVEMLWINDFKDNVSHFPSGPNFLNFTQEAPTDEESEVLLNSVSKIWSGFIETFPFLKSENPLENRKLNTQDKGENKNSLIYRPIGQIYLIAPYIRRLLDKNGINHPNSVEEVIKAIEPLKYVPLDLFDDLWRDFLIVSDEGKYKMRNEQAQECIKVARSILEWLLCLEDLTDEYIEKELKPRWSSLLIPPGDNLREKNTFQELYKIREKISAIT